MLEKQLSVILATYLNKFICDLNDEQLRISIWSGDLVLRDLELRTNILDQIALSLFEGRQHDGGLRAEGMDPSVAAARALLMPFTVVRGVVRKLVISVPWSALDREPVSVEVHGVEIVFGLLRSRPHNAAEDAVRVQAVKQKQLRMFEADRQSGVENPGAAPDVLNSSSTRTPHEGSSNKNSGNTSSYVENLIETITRNIHLVLYDISVKYVFDYDGLAPSFACALVLSVSEIYVTTTDDDWEDRFVMDLSMPFCKKVAISGLKLSVHAIRQENADPNHEEYPHHWKEELTILEMTDLSLCLCLPTGYGRDAEKSGRILARVTTVSPVRLRFSFGAAGALALISNSLNTGLFGVNYRQHLHLLHDTSEDYTTEHPNETEEEKEREKVNKTLALRRWRYVMCCVLDDVRRARNKGRGSGHRFIEGVVSFGQRRREYTALWKRAQGVSWLPPLTPDERSTLAVLEETLTLEQLVFLRCLAYAELGAAQLSRSRQQQYIVDAMRRRCSAVESDVSSDRNNSKNHSADDNNDNSSVTNNSSNWWWFGLRSLNFSKGNRGSAGLGGSETSCIDVSASPRLFGDFDTEWARGWDFLHRISLGQPANPTTTPSTSMSVAMEVCASLVIMELHPHVWRHDVASARPLLAYVERLGQHIESRFVALRCSYSIGPEQRENRVGFTVQIASVSACFVGSLSAPLLEPLDNHSGEGSVGGGGGGGDDDSALLNDPWLSLSVNETHTMLSAIVSKSRLTLRPHSELRWWTAAFSDIPAALAHYTHTPHTLKHNLHSASASVGEGDGCGCGGGGGPVIQEERESQGPYSSKGILLDIAFAGIEVVIPLGVDCFGEVPLLMLHIPAISLTSSGATTVLASALLSSYTLSLVGESPIRLRCETGNGAVDGFALSDFEMTGAITTSGCLTLMVRSCVEMTLDPIVFATVNTYLESLVLKGSRVELLDRIAANDGAWCFDASGAIIIGNTVVSFPFSHCQAYLGVLHELAYVNFKKGDRVSKIDQESQGESKDSFLQSFEIHLWFFHATVRNFQHDDVVEVEFRGGNESVDHDDSASSRIPNRGSDALLFKFTNDRRSCVLQLPDIHIAAPSGQHVFALEKLSVECEYANANDSPRCNVNCASLSLILSPPLVEFVEILLASVASLAPVPSQIMVSTTTATTATATTTTAKMYQREGDSVTVANLELLIQRLQLRVVQHLDEGVGAAAHLSNVALSAESATGRSLVHLEGFLECVECIDDADNDDADGVRSTVIIAARHLCNGESSLMHLELMADLSQTQRVSLRICGGRIDYYKSQWVALAALRNCPAVVHLAALTSMDVCRRGFFMSSDVPATTRHGFRHEPEISSIRNTTLDTTASSPSTSPSSRLEFDGEVCGLELLIATDGHRKVDPLNTATHCRFRLARVALKGGSCVDSIEKVPRWSAESVLYGLFLDTSDGKETDSPLIAQARMRVENHARLAPQGNGECAYVYADGATAGDVSVLVTIEPPSSIGSNANLNKSIDHEGDNHSRTLTEEEGVVVEEEEEEEEKGVTADAAVATAAAAVDVRLTTSMLGSLLCALACNVLRSEDSVSTATTSPIPKSQSLTPTTESSLPQSLLSHSSSVLLTVSSARVVLIGDATQDVFALRGALQFFATSGTTGEAHALHVSSFSLDDISPSPIIVRRDVPRWQQTPARESVADTTGYFKKRLFAIQSAGVFGAGNVTECVIDDVSICAASGSWAGLHHASFSKPVSTALDTLGKPASANQSGTTSSCDKSITTVGKSFETIITLRNFRVVLEEPWGELLAILSIPEVQGRLCGGKTELRICHPLSLKPPGGGISLLQWEKLSEPEEAYMRVTITAPAASTTLERYSFDTPYESKPHFGLSGQLEIGIQSLRVVLDTIFATRLAKYAVVEVEAYTKIFTSFSAFSTVSPSVTCSSSSSSSHVTFARNTPCSPVTSVLAIALSVRDIQFLPPPLVDDASWEWRLAIETLDVQNECAETLLDAPVATATGGVGGELRCLSNVHTVRLRGVSVDHIRLYPLILPNATLRATTPVEGSVFTEWRTSVSVTPDDRTSLQSTYAFVLLTSQHSSIMCRRVRIETEAGACVKLSAMHVRELLRVMSRLRSPISSTATRTKNEAELFSLASYYDAPPPAKEPKTKRASMPMRAAVELPHLSFLLTESGQQQHQKPHGSITEGANSVAELRFLGVLTLHTAIAANAVPTHAQFAVMGGFELRDGHGTAVLYRRLPSGQKQQQDILGMTLQVELLDDPKERRVRVESHGIVLSLHPHTIDFALRIQNFIALLQRDPLMSSTSLGDSPENAEQGEDEEGGRRRGLRVGMNPVTSESVNNATVVAIRLGSFAVMLENAALLEARGVEVRLDYDARQIGEVRPYSFRIADLALRRRDGKHTFVSVGNMEVCLGVGHVNVRTKSFIVNNYDILFYMDVLECVQELHRYVSQNLKFSKVQEEGFKQSVIVSLSDFRVCFFLSRRVPKRKNEKATVPQTLPYSEAVTREGNIVPTLGESGVGGGVEIVFPVVILKQVASTTARSLSFETENGIVCYRRPEGRLPPFVKKISFTFLSEENLVARSRSTIVNLSKVEAFMPLGDTLQCCVEAIAQAFLPLLPAATTVMSDANSNSKNETEGDTHATNPPLRSEQVSFAVPLISLNVCSAQSDEAALVEPPSVLFGVSIHKFHFESNRNGANERTLAQVLSISSTVNTHIQKEFLSATAPRGALDVPSQWALYFLRETTGEVDIPEVQLPPRRVSVIARAHAIRLTVSPRLLSTLNTHVLRHVASGVHRTRHTSTTWVSSRHWGKDASSAHSYSSLGEMGDRILLVSDNFCLSADLILGGRRGTQLRFVKNPIETAPRNRITVKTINHARLFLSVLESMDGVLEPPIVVDAGLTVLFEGVPIVLESGKLGDYTTLGARSTLVAPDALVTVVPPANPKSAFTTQTGTTKEVTTPKRTCPEATSVPLSCAVRWYNMQVNVDVAMDVSLRLWSKHRSLAVAAEAYARYKLEKNCFEGNRGVRDFIDESGEVALANVSILCDSGTITADPTGLLVNVKHYKPEGDQMNTGTTVVRAIVPKTNFTLSLDHIRLLCETSNQLRRGLNHIGSAITSTSVTANSPRGAASTAAGGGGGGGTGGGWGTTMGNRSSSCEVHVPSTQPSVSKRIRAASTSTTATASTVSMPPGQVEPSLLWSRDGESVPQVEFGLSAPAVELMITNDFYKSEFAVALTSIALLARGSRSFSRMTCSGSVTLCVEDYPQSQPPRTILSAAPELAVEYSRYTGSGFSLQGALTCPEASLTVPLVTALRLLRFHRALRRGGAYSFRNSTGAQLLLAPTMDATAEPCCLPPGILVRVDALNYNRTCFRVIADIETQRGNARVHGVAVDLSALQRGATCRVPLSGNGNYSLGVLDGVMRLDEAQRIVDITTSVEVRNDLATYTVCLPASLLEPFVLQPGESRYATLSCLRRPFAIRIDEWSSSVPNALVTLDTLITAFTLLPSKATEERRNINSLTSTRGYYTGSNSNNSGVGVGNNYTSSSSNINRIRYNDQHLLPRRAYKDGDDVLVIPLTLSHENAEQDTAITVRLVFTRRLARESKPRKSQLLPKYEVGIRVSPLITVFNETGAALAIAITDANLTCMNNENSTELSFGPMLNENDTFNWFSQLPEGAVPAISLAFEMGNGIRLVSTSPLPLNFTDPTVIPVRAPSGEVVGLIIERSNHGLFAVRVSALLVNSLHFPVHILDESGTLLAGQPCEGLRAGERLPVALTLTKTERAPRPDALVNIRVRAGGNTSKLTSPFACNAPVLSGMLSSVDGTKVSIFQARRIGGVRAVPVIQLESLWCFRNRSSLLSLQIRCVDPHKMENSHVESDGSENVETIGPLAHAEWTTFAGSTSSDPLVQVRFIGTTSVLFDWSPLIHLATLSSSNVPIALKHHVCATEADVAQAGVAVFTSARVPLILNEESTRERFVCLSVTPSRSGGQFIVDFNLNTAVPLVVENRTSRRLQYEQEQQRQQHQIRYQSRGYTLNAYIVEPFTDGATCFDGDESAPVLRLTLFGGRESTVRAVIELAKAANTREAIRAGEGMYVLCTYDYSLQRYYVSVTMDRSLESTLVFQPRYIVHVETFIRAISVHIASICVPRNENSMDTTPLGPLAVKNELQLGNIITPESTNAEILVALQSCELDIVFIQAVGIYAALSINEKHYLGRLDVGCMSFIDCTSPRPIHPVVLELRRSVEGNAIVDTMKGKPSLSIKFHALAPTGDDVPEVTGSSPKVVTMPFEDLRVEIAPMKVKLCDAFLYVLLQAGKSATEAMQEDSNDTDTKSNVVRHDGKERGVRVEKSKKDTNTMSDMKGSIHANPLIIRNAEKSTQKSLKAFVKDKFFTGESDSDTEEEYMQDHDINNSTISTLPRSLAQEALLYNCRIARLFVSCIELELTLTRRADGRYNPFAGFMLGSTLIPSVEGAPLSINETERSDVNQRSPSPLGALVAVLWPSYRNQIFMQLYKIVGSLEVLGNPIALMSGWRRGVRSFVVEAADLKPLSGARALLLATAASTLHSVGLLSRVGGRTAAAISLDSEWLEGHDATRSAGVLRGMANGLRGGLEGVVVRPLSGARSSGIAGFCGGIATGAAGLLTRPVAGTLDGLGHTVEFLARLMQDAEDVPDAHEAYVRGGRNFAMDKTKATLAIAPMLGTSANVSERGSLTTTPHANGADMTLGTKNNPALTEFIARTSYDRLLEQVKQEGLLGSDAVRFLISSVGLHNYTLHSDWRSFLEYTTPEEFYNWLSIALAAKMAVWIEDLCDLAHPVTPTRRKGSSSLTSTGLQSTTKQQQQQMALERARNIKNTLGIKDMLKYVTLDHFIQVCSLEEVKQNVSPEDMHRKMPSFLLSGVKIAMESIILHSGQ